ncbi:hypothetical protein SAMD00019534_122180 [Acytostelium subglobosum LB1]|uniref:hypothetical protein n=1 Tax=Acytostelium subglobosum LB1 TaxID=1410327 RepID=UPI000644FD22|nr:hypothetical protein SAMD00019534_122180 [Acytostelium subglobosum LB1]GAM29042.1 hypothetical protein SAMD00019534_122180 [Acytostelium subglobosum LB1]|eukprot:XP_012748048.1 hypothetical protein SAMD00019534_122180 [Acytostelium subglobosum LB1]
MEKKPGLQQPITSSMDSFPKPIGSPLYISSTSSSSSSPLSSSHSIVNKSRSFSMSVGHPSPPPPMTLSNRKTSDTPPPTQHPQYKPPLQRQQSTELVNSPETMTRGTISSSSSSTNLSKLSIANDATWMMIVSNWEEWSGRHFRPMFTKYVYQGIPDHFRPAIWIQLSNMIKPKAIIPTCTELTLKYKMDSNRPLNIHALSTTSTSVPTAGQSFTRARSSSLAISPPTLYNTNRLPASPFTNSPPILTNLEPLPTKIHKCFYSDILKHTSEYEEQIKVDVQRTFPDMPEALRDHYSSSLCRVLKAVSLYDKEMGYCQGISFVGSIIITKVPEEETFHILVRLLEGVMRDFYTIGMRGLKLRLFQLSRLVRDLFPKLHSHLEKIDLDFTIFASPWFMTAFSYHLSEECVVRILDVILLQGIEAYFSVGLAIFQMIESDVINCTDSAQVMDYFRSHAKEKIDVGTLMDIASRIHVSSNQLDAFAQQFEMDNSGTPHIPTTFDPNKQPKQKAKDPNWVVKKYKLLEKVHHLEQELANKKLEFYHITRKNEEEKLELVRRLQLLSERESSLVEQNREATLKGQQLLKENEVLKEKLLESERCNNYLVDNFNQLRKNHQNIK